MTPTRAMRGYGWLLIPVLLWLGGPSLAASVPIQWDPAALPAPAAGDEAPRAHQMTITAFGRDLTAVLLRSSALPDTPQAHDLGTAYRGHILGDDDSWLRWMVTDRDISGYLFLDGRLWELTSGTGRLRYLQPDSLLNVLHAVDTVSFAPVAGDPPHSSNTNSDIQLRMSEAAQVPRAMRVGIVVDSRFNEHHRGRGEAEARRIMNGVDGIYQNTLGLAIRVDRIVTWTDPETDPMRNRGGTVEDILRAFGEERSNDARLPNDLALVHLFTGHIPDGEAIGLGWIGTVCRNDGFDISLSTPYAGDMLLAAHEIGHNLGALHDEDAACAGQVDDDRQLMSSRLTGSTRADFSSCSLARLRPALNLDCNLDNIDVAISLRATRANAPRQRIVAVQVDNRDAFRVARNVVSHTEFPQGTVLSNASAGCRIDAAQLRCNYPDIAPGDSTFITVLATLPDFDNQRIRSTIGTPTFADSLDLDNVATLDALQFDDAGGDNAVLVAGAGQTPTASSSGGSGGLGAAGVWLCLLLGVQYFRRCD